MRVILLSALVLAILGTILYQVKTSIDVREAKLEVLEAQITQNKREIAILEAEWAFLSRPERVMDLSDRLLGMQPMAKNRILPIDAIPMRLVPKFKESVVAPGQMKPASGDGIAPTLDLFKHISTAKGTGQ
jgi:cell division protein FtsL